MRSRISSGDVGDVKVEHLHRALLGHEETQQRLEERALAGAVRAEQADRARREDRRDVVQREVLAVTDAQVIGLDDGPGEPGGGRSLVLNVGIRGNVGHGRG